MIIRALVLAHSSPIHGFRSGGCVRVALNDLRISVLGISPLLMHEGYSGQPHLLLSAKFILREVTLDPPPFVAVRVHNEHGRCPYRIEAMKVGGMFFDVCFHR